MYPIPANATRIRYLGSNGTQWIDTGYYVSDQTDIELAFQPGTFNSTAGWRCFFGARMNNIGASSSRVNTPMIWMINSRQLALNDYQSYDSGGISAYAPANTLSVFEVRGRKLYLNGTQYAESGQTSIYRSTVTMGLLRCHYADGWEAATEASRQLPGKIYHFKVYEGGVLAMHLVPVRVGTVGYLFDRVSGRLFGNAGTGDFALGPDTFSQGVVPTRMMAMGVRKESVAPGIYVKFDNVTSEHAGLTNYTDTLRFDLTPTVNAMNWSIWLRDGQTLPNDPSEFSGISICDPDTGGDIVMLWNGLEDFALIDGIDTSSPAVDPAYYVDSGTITITKVSA